MENFLGVALLYKISENLLESKPFKTSHELPFFFAKLALCMFNLCYYVPNLHTTPNYSRFQLAFEKSLRMFVCKFRMFVAKFQCLF